MSALTVGAPDEFVRPEGSVSVLAPDFEAYVVVGGLVDLSAEAARLEKELAKAEKDLASVSRTLSNEGFVAKAAADVIEKKRAQRDELSVTVERLSAQIADLA